MKTASYIFSILGLVAMLTSSLIKGSKMKNILFLVFLGNACVSISYLLDGSGLNGAASCLLGATQSIINFFFDKNNKKVPRTLVCIYALSFIAVNVIVSYDGLFTSVKTLALCLLAICGCLAFVMCIGQKNGAKYRFWTIVNMVMWCVYDIVCGAYSVLITHVIQLLFAVAGMIIHDRKKDNEKSSVKTEA